MSLLLGMTNHHNGGISEAALSETTTGRPLLSASISVGSNCPTSTQFMKPIDSPLGHQSNNHINQNQFQNVSHRLLRSPQHQNHQQQQNQRVSYNAAENASTFSVMGAPRLNGLGHRTLNNTARGGFVNNDHVPNVGGYHETQTRAGISRSHVQHGTSSIGGGSANMYRSSQRRATSPYVQRRLPPQGTVLSPNASMFGGTVHQGGSTMTGATYTTGGQRIIGEYTTEQVLHGQKKVYVEETYDEVVVIPHKKVVEKIIDDPQTVRQRIVEVEVPQYVHREVEVPEVEYVEIDVPYPETVYMENIIRQPKIETVERIVEVPKIVYQEKIVEVPTMEYREVEEEHIVEVPEEHIETKLVPKYMPQYVEVDVPEIIDVIEEEQVDKNIPIPLEHTILVDLKFPKIYPKYLKKEVPVYVPRFIEIPIPVDKLDDVTLLQAQEALEMLHCLESVDGPATLAQMEQVVSRIVEQDWSTVLARLDETQPNAWTTNFMTSQIPIIMEAVVRVAADVQALGATQMNCTESVRVDGGKGATIVVRSGDMKSQDEVSLSDQDMDDDARQMSVVEDEH